MMSNDDRVRLAAYNNAMWCDSVCRAHGLGGEFAPGIWLNRNQVPQFYPNAVTISDEVDTAVQLEKIKTLMASRIPGQISVKDSFCALDLNALGFDILFDARWIYRSPSTPPARVRIESVRWSRIVTALDLIRWEDAWRGDQASTSQSRIFMPALLEDRDIAIIAASRGDRILAGLIANRSGEVVGMSNNFAPTGEEQAFGVEGIATMMDAFRGLPIVGYEGGPALETALHLGFEAIGALRVWCERDPSSRLMRA